MSYPDEKFKQVLESLINPLVDSFKSAFESCEKIISRVKSVSKESTDEEYPTAKAVYTLGEEIKKETSETYEKISNRDTVIDSDSTDEKYPSSKATYEMFGRAVQAAVSQAATITFDNADIAEVSTNLFDKNAEGIVVGRYLLNDTGEEVEDETCIISDYIAVENNSTYSTRVNYELFKAQAIYVALYDSDKNYIGYATGELGSITNTYSSELTFTVANEDAAYVRLTIHRDYVDKHMLVAGDIYPSEYIGYGLTLNEKVIIPQLEEKASKTPIPSKNLFNINTISNVGYRMNYTDGKEESVGEYVHSDYIPVVSGETYTYTGGHLVEHTNMIKQCVYYDKDRGFVKSEVNIEKTDPIQLTIPDEVAYIIFNFYTIDYAKANVQFELGTEATEYEPYKDRYRLDGLIVKSNQVENDETDIPKIVIESIFSSNFDLKKLTFDANGIRLTTKTGLADHTNLLWMNGQKDSAELEFMVTFDTTLFATNSAQFFVTNKENTKEFLLFTITITPYTEYTYVNIRPFLYRAELGNSALVAQTAVNSNINVVKKELTYNFKIRVANGIMYIYCENLYVGKFDLAPFFTQNKTLGCSYRAEQPDSILAYSDIKVKEEKEPYIHISYDDCIRCLYDIDRNADTYTSIFDNNFLSSLKIMHLNYGAVFTLNLFGDYNAGSWELSNMTNKFKNEFAENSDWLKFSVHWLVAGVYPDTLTDEEIVSGYREMTDRIIAFSSLNNVDRMIRPSYFSLNKSAQIALKSSNALFDGCLTSDDSRTNDCGMTSTERSVISTVDDYMDYENEIYYCRTTKRMDSLDVGAQKEILDKELADRKNNKAFIVFAHESDDTTDLTPVCEWAKEHGIRFDYPMFNNPKR